MNINSINNNTVANSEATKSKSEIRDEEFKTIMAQVYGDKAKDPSRNKPVEKTPEELKEEEKVGELEREKRKQEIFKMLVEGDSAKTDNAYCSINGKEVAEKFEEMLASN